MVARTLLSRSKVLRLYYPIPYRGTTRRKFIIVDPPRVHRAISKRNRLLWEETGIVQPYVGRHKAFLMKTYVYVAVNQLARRVGWISGALDDHHPKATKALVKFIDGSDSRLIERSQLKPLSDMEKVLWKITD